MTALIFIVWTGFTAGIKGKDNKQQTNCDSLAIKLKQYQKWNEQLSRNNDSVVKLAFYLSKDYITLKKELKNYKPVSKAELLIDEMNDLMLTGCDVSHRFTNMLDSGEGGHFFDRAKKELDALKVKYYWDVKICRYALVK